MTLIKLRPMLASVFRLQPLALPLLQIAANGLLQQDCAPKIPIILKRPQTHHVLRFLVNHLALPIALAPGSNQ